MTPRVPAVALSLLLLILGPACTSVVKSTGSPLNEDPGKRTVGTVIDDSEIEVRAAANLGAADPLLKSSHISVVSFNGTVLLVGQVPSEQMKQLAGTTVRAMRKVRSVHNELEVGGPTAMMTRSADTWLTAKIKARMLGAKNLDASNVKVVTENGVVYLMGLMTRAEAEVAVETTSATYGVQRIVKVFEYID
jgi:osmotically-inducible protein OsmY